MSLSRVDRSMAWRPPAADLYSTGASGAVPVRPVNPVTPVESVDAVGQGAGALRAEVTADADRGVQRDWTTQPETAPAEKPPDPLPEPISKQLLEFLQSVWRAGASAVEISDEQKQANGRNRNQAMGAEQPLTYAPPKVKRG